MPACEKGMQEAVLDLHSLALLQDLDYKLLLLWECYIFHNSLLEKYSITKSCLLHNQKVVSAQQAVLDPLDLLESDLAGTDVLRLLRLRHAE